MISKAQVVQAVDDGLLDAIKDHVKIGTVNILSESAKDEAAQFEAGLRKIIEAGEIQHGIVEKIFPG